MNKKDRIEIMFEKMQDDIKLVLEGHNALREEMKKGFDGLRGEVKDVKFQVKTVDTSVKLLNNEVKELNTKLDRHINQPAHLAHLS